MYRDFCIHTHAYTNTNIVIVDDYCQVHVKEFVKMMTIRMAMTMTMAMSMRA